MTRNKFLLLAGLFLFVIGFTFGFSLNKLDEYDMPNAIYIRKGGHKMMYAKTRPEDAILVNMPDLKNDPGLYLSFPVYSDNKNIEGLVK